MFYKEDNGEWWTGVIVHLPSGEVLTEKEHSKNGWVWYDEPPKKYLSWLEIKNKEQ